VGIGGDLLATAAGVAGGGGVGEAAPGAPETTSRGRAHQPVTGRGGLEFDPRGPGGEKPAPNPTDRARKGSKHHVCTDGQGVPLSFEVTAANVNDGTRLVALVDSIPPIPGLAGRPRRRPHRVQGDRAYDSAANRAAMRLRGIEPVLARRGTEHGSGLGLTRWVVERTHSWLHQFRRLRVCFEQLAKIHEALLWLGASLICARILESGF
jgi:transposase